MATVLDVETVRVRTRVEAREFGVMTALELEWRVLLIRRRVWGQECRGDDCI